MSSFGSELEKAKKELPIHIAKKYSKCVNLPNPDHYKKIVINSHVLLNGPSL